MSRTFRQDYATVYEDCADVYGDFVTVYGKRCRVHGSFAKVYGDGCLVYGSFAKVFGNGCIVSGDQCKVFGRDCTVTGSMCKIFNQIGPAASDRPAVKRGAFSRVNFSGSGMTITVHGEGGEIYKYESDGKEKPNLVNNRIILDGQDITDACLVTDETASSSGTVAVGIGRMESTDGGSVSSSSSRKRPHDAKKPEKKRPARAATPPLPIGHKTQEAEGDEKECVICETNRIDARVHPCGHTEMCVDCASKIYDSGESKRLCPTCKEPFRRVDVARLTK